MDATRYAEVLELRAADAEVLAVHAVGWFSGSAAVVRRPLGDGLVIHCGVGLNDAALEWLWRAHLARQLEVSSRVGAVPHPARACLTLSSDAAEALTRHDRDVALHFVLNHGPTPVTCEVSDQIVGATRDLLSGQAVPAGFELPGYSYRILRQALGSA